MAGAVLTPFEDFGKFVVEDQEQTRDLRYEWANSVADIKRDEEIKQLKTLVTKLSEEVNKLENIIVDMGARMGMYRNLNEGPFHDFTVILRPDDNGTFVAYVPAISGCHAWGRTPQEAQSELVNVFEMIKEEYVEEGKQLPGNID
jgi:predicted RNase H-like HicB family nuclease